MKISKISARNLFGYLQYDIEIKGNITIIHGPNGCGKTSLLRLVQGVFDWNYKALEEINFGSIIFEFDNNIVLEIHKSDIEDTKAKKKVRKEITAILSAGGTEINRGVVGLSFELSERVPMHELDMYIPDCSRIGPDRWRNNETGEIYTFDEILVEHGHSIPWVRKQRLSHDWYDKIISETHVQLIQTQRLIRVRERRRGYEESKSLLDSIEIYNNEVKELIASKLTEYARIAQDLDRTFPLRLLDSSYIARGDEEAIRVQYGKIIIELQELGMAGLLDDKAAVQLPDRKLDASEIRVLELYLQDTHKKLETLAPLKKKLNILTTIISEKFAPNKSLGVSKDRGLFFDVTATGHRLKTKSLSSGEQHQVVVFYELLFKSRDNALILIDEPEISLHVDWQRKFLDDIERVAGNSDQRFIVATHSPQIVNGRWDHAIALGGGVEK